MKHIIIENITQGKSNAKYSLQLRKRLFGHKRTRSDPDFDDLIAPVANGQSNGTLLKEQKQVGIIAAVGGNK